jgi:uncharacterized protein
VNGRFQPIRIRSRSNASTGEAAFNDSPHQSVESSVIASIPRRRRLGRPSGALVLFLFALVASPAALGATARDSASLARFAGVYRLAPRELLEIQVSDAGNGALFFSEPRSGRAGPLVPMSSNEFVAGPNLRDRAPIERRARFELGSDGRVTAVQWEVVGEPSRRAARARAAIEATEIASGDAQLAATLTRPCSPGPFPAIVLIHGSGPATRSGFGTFPEMCAALGIACLAYDKRGAGGSSGRYHDFLTVDQLATDARAAVALLKRRADVDSARIGIAAWSQGGWVAARLAELSAPAFVLLISSPTQSVAENGLFEIANELRAGGFGEQPVAESSRLNRLFNRMVLRGGSQWDTIRTELLRARREPWFHLARLPDSLPPTPAPANLRWIERLRLYMEYDPIHAWRGMRAPLLAFYGGMDRNVPGGRSAEELRSALQYAGNRDVTIRLTPDADHWLWRLPASGKPEERRAKVEGLGALIADWLVAHARPKGAPECPVESGGR